MSSEQELEPGDPGSLDGLGGTPKPLLDDTGAVNETGDHIVPDVADVVDPLTNGDGALDRGIEVAGESSQAPAGNEDFTSDSVSPVPDQSESIPDPVSEEPNSSLADDATVEGYGEQTDSIAEEEPCTEAIDSTGDLPVAHVPESANFQEDVDSQNASEAFVNPGINQNVDSQDGFGKNVDSQESIGEDLDSGGKTLINDNSQQGYGLVDDHDSREGSSSIDNQEAAETCQNTEAEVETVNKEMEAECLGHGITSNDAIEQEDGENSNEIPIEGSSLQFDIEGENDLDTGANSAAAENDDFEALIRDENEDVNTGEINETSEPSLTENVDLFEDKEESILENQASDERIASEDLTGYESFNTGNDLIQETDNSAITGESANVDNISENPETEDEVLELIDENDFKPNEGESTAIEESVNIESEDAPNDKEEELMNAFDGEESNQEVDEDIFRTTNETETNDQGLNIEGAKESSEQVADLDQEMAIEEEWNEGDDAVEDVEKKDKADIEVLEKVESEPIEHTVTAVDEEDEAQSSVVDDDVSMDIGEPMITDVHTIQESSPVLESLPDTDAKTADNNEETQADVDSFEPMETEADECGNKPINTAVTNQDSESTVNLTVATPPETEAANQEPDGESADASQPMETGDGVTDNIDRSSPTESEDQSGSSKEATPSVDILKIKQEKIEEAEKQTVTSLKIVGVTSAVGQEEQGRNSMETKKGDNSADMEIQNGSTVVIKGEVSVETDEGDLGDEAVSMNTETETDKGNNSATGSEKGDDSAAGSEKGEDSATGSEKGDDSGRVMAGGKAMKSLVTTDALQRLKEKSEALLNKKVDTKSDDKKAVKEEKVNIADEDDDDVIAVKEEKKPVQKPKSKIQTCIVCGKVGKCKYNIVRNGDVKHLCDDRCFKQFRSSPTTYLRQAETSKSASNAGAAKGGNKATAPVKPLTPSIAATASEKLAQAKATEKAVVKPSEKNSLQQPHVYKTCAVCQLMNVRTSKPFLNWQGMDFCGEECLGKFQATLSSNCSYCSSPIFQNNKTKFCCSIGSEVKHFCSNLCYTEFTKRVKFCSYCNQDLSQVTDSFMAPVGDQGTFKDFCSQMCLKKFESKKDLENQQGKAVNKAAPKGNFVCAVCGKVGPVKHEIKNDSKINRLCSLPCFSAFKYANKITMHDCDNCGLALANDGQTNQYIQFEGQQKRFCSFMCVNTFRTANKKVVPCAWCSATKVNFDMIERVDANNKFQLFCSLNCLSLYRVNLQATSNQAVMCDQCQKYVPAQYHLTMSDASVRNFCCYGCVMAFQQQFQAPKQGAAGATTGPPPQQAPQVVSPQTSTVSRPQQTTTRSGRVVNKVSGGKTLPAPASKTAVKGGNKTSNSDTFPIISNVVSLAPQAGKSQEINIKTSTPVSVNQQLPGVKTSTVTTGNQTVQQQIIIQPPPPKQVKNKSLICKPLTQTKATSCRPHTQIKSCQTDKSKPDRYMIPVPVPIYCPTPLAMYSTPTPVPVFIPIPIPVPVFIPTTKKNGASILKQIREIREKIPADPLEAELLMMADIVAGKEMSDNSSSDEENEDLPALEAPPVKSSAASTTGNSSSAPGATEGDLGEDMLQMALRMASEMSDEPVMDLENSLEPVAVNTAPPAPPPQPARESTPDNDEEYIPANTRSRRSRGGGTKRPTRSAPRRQPAKRQKIEPIQPTYKQPSPSPPPQPAAPPPDANFHLKFTYGVNAFKHWVLQKNAQIEQASKPGMGKMLKTFKSDILQCTADELNFALCLFVKEVRKPNGEEYAVDSIFYLCLGMQQYLFENSRIDNIFSDFYYERFTESLNEILTRYEPKLNHAGQLVCRIEEEHLWESKQLGAHSPHVLLNSLVYFNTKYFMLKTTDDHLRLSFTHIMKHWKKSPTGRGSGTGANTGRSVYLRYYCPTPQGKDIQKKKKEEMPVYEQTENLDNPLRCPVKLYEFYLSKCPESIKNRNDTFYLVPERSCVPDSPVWYSTATLGVDHMAKMLNRIRLVREIQEAHLHTQPIYI